MWDTDLVSLNPTELDKKPNQQFGTQSQYNCNCTPNCCIIFVVGNNQFNGQGGFGNQGYNNGNNMNFSANLGGVPANNGGFGNNFGYGNNQSNFGFGGGYQQQAPFNNQAVAGGNESTPFDF